MDLEQTRIFYASYGSSYLKGFSVSGLSYDPVSKDLLIQFHNNLQSSMAKVDPCKNEEIQDKLYFKGMNHVYAGPFALYESDIYYLAKEVYAKEERVMLTLTIRKVTGCQDEDNTFLGQYGLDKKNCSVHVAKVLEEVILTGREGSEWEPEDLIYFYGSINTVGSKLLVIKQNGQLYFLVQIANPVYRSDPVDLYSLDLYEVKEGGEAKKLFSSTERSKFSNYNIDNIGDISFKDGLLCWSTFESIWCDDWPRTAASPVVRQIIKPGDAGQVCNVSSDLEDYQNIITGIELINGNGQIEMIFGCWASYTSNGGAGYLTANSDGSNRQIEMIADKKGKIFAGNMVITDGCPSSPKQRKDTLQGLRQILRRQKMSYWNA